MEQSVWISYTFMMSFIVLSISFDSQSAVYFSAVTNIYLQSCSCYTAPPRLELDVSAE